MSNRAPRIRHLGRIVLAQAFCLSGFAAAQSLAEPDMQPLTAVSWGGIRSDVEVAPLANTANQAAAASCGPISLTQSTNPVTVSSPSTVACSDSDLDCTTDNEFARSYDLSTGATAGVPHYVRCIEYAVEVVEDVSTGTSPVTVSLFVDTNGGAPDVANLVLLDSIVDDVSDGTTTQRRTVDFTPNNVLVPADATLVVSVSSPDLCTARGADHKFFHGSNDLGQSAPSYIRSDACGIPDYVTYASIGFPDVHLVTSVSLEPSGVSCVSDWSSEFGLPGLDGGSVSASTEFDDGSGPALYVAGTFTSADGTETNHIAKWDGAAWAPLGNGIPSGIVRALAVYDDGTGSALYAGGSFTMAGAASVSNIAKWDGSAWSALGSGVIGGTTPVQALTVFDDGTGPALFVGGAFTTAGGVGGTNRIAKWDGATWNQLGIGMDSEVSALHVFDDGGGAALYAGGVFTTAGGISANGMAKWDGATWSALDTGVNGRVSALAVFDDGLGPVLFAGGFFDTAGGASARGIARWDGANWTDLGTTGSTRVLTMAVFDDGFGPALYAGSDTISTVSGLTDEELARWDGTAWTQVPGEISGGFGQLNTLTVFDDGSGSSLYVGGDFNVVGDVAANNVALWDGADWSGLSGGQNGLNERANAAIVFDDGSGPALFVGGAFSSAGPAAAHAIAKWDGTTWSPVGPGFSEGGGGVVNALAIFDDGTGPALYAGGNFRLPLVGSFANIAKWDGTTWTALGAGIGTGGSSGQVVHALAVYDDGTGPALYAAGDFAASGGVLGFNNIAKWDGSTWSPLGSGIDNTVFSLAVFDSGTGPFLYAGGRYWTAGGVSVNNIARWDGSSFSSVGAGIGVAAVDRVSAMTVFDDGSGSKLYVGGEFTSAGGVGGRNNIARWTGSTWEGLGTGANFAVTALTVYDDGFGPALFVGGRFLSIAGITALRIAKFDGSTWSSLGAGLQPEPEMLAGFDEPAGPALFAGGPLTHAGKYVSAGIAKWQEVCTDQSGPFLGDDVCVGGSNDGGSCGSNADCPGGACGLKSRYISITPAIPSIDPLSIQVTVLDIDDGLGLDAHEGEIWWASASQTLPNVPLADLVGAEVACEANPSHAETWPDGILHLFGPPIVPGSTYEVRTCDAAGANCSEPLTVSTGKWGDVVSPFGGGLQPNFADVTALVDKFKDLESAPDVSRTDLVPEVPNHVTNFADISADVDAFKGSLYPNAIPACP